MTTTLKNTGCPCLDEPAEKAVRSISEGDCKRPVAAGDPVELRKTPCVVTAGGSFSVLWVVGCPSEPQAVCVAFAIVSVPFAEGTMLDALSVELELLCEYASSTWMSILTPLLYGETMTSTLG